MCKLTERTTLFCLPALGMIDQVPAEFLQGGEAVLNHFGSF